VALFVSIVAVGLGPALWLGVQFGTVEIAPARQQPVVSEQRPDGQELLGGTGAGSAANADGETVVRTTPRSGTRPITSSPSPSASPSATEPEPSGSPSESTDPGDDPAPTEDQPTGDPTLPGDEPDYPTLPPEPPTIPTVPTTSPADEGGIGAGEKADG
jgi:hypothetical protein